MSQHSHVLARHPYNTVFSETLQSKSSKFWGKLVWCSGLRLCLGQDLSKQKHTANQSMFSSCVGLHGTFFHVRLIQPSNIVWDIYLKSFPFSFHQNALVCNTSQNKDTDWEMRFNCQYHLFRIMTLHKLGLKWNYMGSRLTTFLGGPPPPPKNTKKKKKKKQQFKKQQQKKKTRRVH